MGFWNQKVVGVERTVYARIRGMCEEVYYFEEGDYPNRAELETMTETTIGRILDEYVRQHFEEANKVAARMILDYPGKHSSLITR